MQAAGRDGTAGRPDGRPENASRGRGGVQARSVVGIDIGGTFTDTVVVDDQGAVSSFKTPTTPDRLIEGLLTNLREAAGDQGLSGFLGTVERIAHGTTAATNAFLE